MKRLREEILRALLAKEMTFWDLILRQTSHFSQLTQSLLDLEGEGLIQWKSDRLTLTPKGREEAREAGLRPLYPLKCPTCSGRGITLDGPFQEVLKEFKKISVNRPKAIPEFDQGYVEPEVSVARVAFLYSRGDLENQHLIILGDDDLTSIAAALSGMPRHITVLEIDERLLHFISQVASNYGFKDLITLHKYDVQRPLPNEAIRGSDVFFTDPVETLSGITLFLSRCAEALKGKGCSGYFGLTHLEASRAKWHEIQRRLLEMKFAITDIIRDFHEYALGNVEFILKEYPLINPEHLSIPPAPAHWYTSSLVRVEAIDNPSPLYLGAVELGDELYIDPETYVNVTGPAFNT